MQKELSQDEIDSMVRAARAGAGGEARVAERVVQPWDVRQAGQIGRDQMRSISHLHETFARNLTNSIGAYLRIVFECSFVSAEHLTYRDYLQSIPEKSYLATCNLSPVGVVAVMHLDLSVVFPIIDLLLGGEGRGGDLGRSTTEIEEQVLESILRIICRELQNTWQALAIVFDFGQRQAVGQALRLMPAEEKNLCLSFEVKMQETRGTLSVAVPAVVSNALLRKISAEISYRRPRGAKEEQERVRAKLLECPFPVELCVPNLQMPLDTLAKLEPGKVLTFERSTTSPAVLVVEDIRLASAAPVKVLSKRGARVLAVDFNTSKGGEQ